MNIQQYIKGKIRLRILTADSIRVLSILHNNQISIEDIKEQDALLLEITVFRHDYAYIKKLILHCVEKITIIEYMGIFRKLKSVVKRPVLTIMIILLFALTIYLPHRILFIRVDGNDAVPVRLIEEKAAICGVRFGAYRKQIQNEHVKNALLEMIPQMQWVGVNTKGCVATILVKERSVPDRDEKITPGISSIVADYDGIIQSLTVTEGSAVCHVGQAVKKGEILISGYTDQGFLVQGTHAQGEIIALTNRNLNVNVLTNGIKRGRLIGSGEKYYVQLGKKQINLYNNSRISDATCVKIYDKKVVTLPGQLSLPVCIIKETVLFYETQPVQTDDQMQYAWVKEYSRQYLQNTVIIGEVLTTNETAQLTQEAYTYNAHYSCRELIGKRKKEELIG